MMHQMKGQIHSVAKLFRRSFAAVFALASVAPVFAQTNYSALPVSTNSVNSTNVPGWITQPLSMVEALNLTLKQSSALQKARADLEASRGLVIQTRAVALPTVAADGNYTRRDTGLIENFIKSN